MDDEVFEQQPVHGQGGWYSGESGEGGTGSGERGAGARTDGEQRAAARCHYGAVASKGLRQAVLCFVAERASALAGERQVKHNNAYSKARPSLASNDGFNTATVTGAQDSPKRRRCQKPALL